MEQRGTLKSWNDQKGFGFIVPDQGGQTYLRLSPQCAVIAVPQWVIGSSTWRVVMARDGCVPSIFALMPR